MAKTLIIGGGGFIGGHLAQALVRDGEQVDIIDNFSRAVRDPFFQELEKLENVNIIDVDISSLGSTSLLSYDYKYIYQFAAILGVQHVLQRPYEVLLKNVLIQTKAIELAKQQKALQRFIFSSTSEIYAGSLKHMGMPIPTPENVPIALTELDHPRTSYMLSKIYGEAMCQHSGLPFTIVRPHNLYGPRMGMAHVLPELMKKALPLPQKGKLEVASVNHRRAFCYIDDAIKIMRELVSNTKAVCGTYNLGNQKQEITIGKFASLVLEAIDRSDLEIIFLPETPGSPERRCPDMTLTHKVIGKFNFIDLKEGINETYKWYAKNVFSKGGVSAI